MNNVTWKFHVFILRTTHSCFSSFHLVSGFNVWVALPLEFLFEKKFFHYTRGMYTGITVHHHMSNEKTDILFLLIEALNWLRLPMCVIHSALSLYFDSIYHEIILVGHCPLNGFSPRDADPIWLEKFII